MCVHCLPSHFFKHQNRLTHTCVFLVSILCWFIDCSPSVHLCDHMTLRKKGKKLKNDPCWACQYNSIFDSYKIKQPYCQKGFDRMKWTILTGYHESIWWVVSDECSHFIVNVLMCDEFPGLSWFLTAPWKHRMLPLAKALLCFVSTGLHKKCRYHQRCADGKFWVLAHRRSQKKLH